MQLYTKEVNNELHQRNPEIRMNHSFMSGAEKLIAWSCERNW